MASHPPSAAAPLVSVVLCTFNRSQLLGGAVEALLRQDPETPAYEVIVVDNNSTDATRDVIEGFLPGGRVRYQFESRQGLSVARNRGIEIARGDIIAFTDDDVRVRPAWVRSIVQAFAEHQDVDMIGGKVQP
ncbi:MAG: glycosyltransferase family A protein, partial [Burkholderiales bacterium]